MTIATRRAPLGRCRDCWIAQRRGKGLPEDPERYRAINERAADGESYADIARDFGITRQRVQQIVAAAEGGVANSWVRNYSPPGEATTTEEGSVDPASIEEYVEKHLKFTERHPVTWDYDREADVLYISFGDLEPAIAADAGEGVLIRFRERDGTIVGITIIEVSLMLAETLSPRPRTGRSHRQVKSPVK